ncbi:hypothetical protein F383_26302 [Gossypium arboreum]|uniref:Uncharacterized protein n=1 Tax=Gossypium arboreum TaxID=29729 RepID=A0A0B0MU49_GOSAR|nr:hypothetical protein F383_26302 [Gossypium arboreum]
MKNVICFVTVFDFSLDVSITVMFKKVTFDKENHYRM